MSMHRCLTIPEILFVICGSMYTHKLEDDHQSDKALASLARTCQSFTVPAVTHLWKIQRALAPLIRCMPPDLWVEEGGSKLTFRRAVRDTDWERYDFYASKIVQLGDPPKKKLSLLRTRDAHPTVFMSLAAYRPLRPLLPNLRALVCTGSTSGLLPAIQGFIGPKLVHVKVNSSNMYDEHDVLHPINTLDLDSLFSSLPRLSPFIKNLEFRGTGGAVAVPAFIDMLRKLQHLAILGTDTELPPTTLNHLSNLPSLERFFVPIISPSNMRIFTTNRSRFSNLDQFGFATKDIPNASIITILDSMQCRFSQLGCFFTEGFESLAEAGLLIASLRHHRCRTSLKVLKLSVSTPLGVHLPTLFTAESLRPLSSFSALTYIAIEPSMLDDPELREFAQAWPNLEQLVLRSSGTAKPKSTLEGIIPLIKFCPKLCSLGVTINAHPIPPTRLDGIHNNHIKTIMFDYSTVVQPKKVFRLLIRMFPYLTAVTFREARHLYTVEESSAYKNGWDEINNLLRETR